MSHNDAIRDLIAAARGQDVPRRSWPSLDREPVGSGNIPVVGGAGQELAHGGLRFGPYLRNDPGWDSISGSEIGALYYMGWVIASVLAIAHRYPEDAGRWLRAAWAFIALGSTPRPHEIRQVVYDSRGQRREFQRSPGAAFNAAFAFAHAAGNRSIFKESFWPPSGPSLPERSTLGPLLSAALGQSYSSPSDPWPAGRRDPVFEWPLWMARRYKAAGGDFGLDVGYGYRSTLTDLVTTGSSTAARAAVEMLDGYRFDQRNSYGWAGGPGVRVSWQQSTRARENKPGYSLVTSVDGVSSWYTRGWYPGGDTNASGSHARVALVGDDVTWTITGDAVQGSESVSIPALRIEWVVLWTADGPRFYYGPEQAFADAGPAEPAPTPEPEPEPVPEGVDEALRQINAAVRNLTQDPIRPRHLRRARARLEAAQAAIGGG